MNFMMSPRGRAAYVPAGRPTLDAPLAVVDDGCVTDDESKAEFVDINATSS
jgi:hypothetical protein